MPGNPKEVGSPSTIEALVPSALNVAVLAMAFPPRDSPMPALDAAAIGSEKVTVMGARSTTFVAPVAGTVVLTVGGVRSTFTVTGPETICGEPLVLFATRVCGPSATPVVSQVKVYGDGALRVAIAVPPSSTSEMAAGAAPPLAVTLIATEPFA